MPRPPGPHRHPGAAGRTGSRASRTGCAARARASRRVRSPRLRIVRCADDQPIDIASAYEAASPLPAPVTAWDHVLHAFLRGLLRGDRRSTRTFAGYHLVDDRWPDLSEAGRLARLETYATARDGRGTPTLRTPSCRARSASTAPSCWSSSTSCASATRSCATRRGIRCRSCTSRAAACSASCRASTRPGASGVPRSRHASRACPTVLADSLEGLTGLPDRPGLAAPPGHGAGAAGGHHRPRRRRARPRPDAARPKARRRSSWPGSRPPQAAATVAVERFRVGARRHGPRAGRRRGSAGCRALTPPSCADAVERPRPGRAARRARRDHARCAPRCSAWRDSSGRPGCPDDAPPGWSRAGDVDGEDALVRRVLDAIARRAPGPGRPARLVPGRGRPHRGVLPRRTTSSASPMSRCPSSGRPVFMRAYGRAFLDSPGSPRQAACRATSSSRRRPTTRHPRRSSPTCARTTTGCCACCASTRAFPGTTSSWPGLEPVDVAHPDHLQRRHVRRGLGGLRRPR